MRAATASCTRQRLEVGAQVDRSPRGADGEPTGFDLALTGVDPTDPATFGREAWTMAGADGVGPSGGRPRAGRGGRWPAVRPGSAWT